MFFLSDTFLLDTWYSDAKKGGIIFDRFRLMDYHPSGEQFTKTVFAEIVLWTTEAMARLAS